jgi:hypothetical protein
VYLVLGVIVALALVRYYRRAAEADNSSTPAARQL